MDRYIIDTQAMIKHLTGVKVINNKIDDIPELHDRLIAGTAKSLDLPLITNDPQILKSNYVQCV